MADKRIVDIGGVPSSGDEDEDGFGHEEGRVGR